jgi:hypothetical protein
MTDDFPLPKPPRSYDVCVKGFDPVTYIANTPGKARAKAYRSYTDAYDIDFKRFLKISTIRRNKEKNLKPILVQGKPAWQTYDTKGNSIPFVYNDTDFEMRSHILDVQFTDWTKSTKQKYYNLNQKS